MNSAIETLGKAPKQHSRHLPTVHLNPLNFAALPASENTKSRPPEWVVARLVGNEKVEQEGGPSKGRYRLVVDGIEVEMTYSRVGDDLIIIDHTEVPAALRGRKVGERLVRQGIEDARRDGIEIIPLCLFAKAQIGRHPEWHHVLRRS
ncbi:N-acetyltransferase [Tianweitania sp. Rool2]|uniref:N-acetyltransferase n=2 Tax=Oryzicola mucosus TaxID=2767425 RepID=A0A8J6PZA7_9HYPH|nr:N-acetyltransferase [Oryzicola mucosus]